MLAMRGLSRFGAQKCVFPSLGLRWSSNAGNVTTTPASRKGNGGVKGQGKDLSYDFDKEVSAILRKIHTEVMKMRESNQGIEVDFYPDEAALYIHTKQGRLNLFKESERCVLVFQSFNSGNINYSFDPKERQWLSNMDKHDLRGIVIRDLIKHNTGMPNLD